jgi:hypothetical protein
VESFNISIKVIKLIDLKNLTVRISSNDKVSFVSDNNSTNGNVKLQKGRNNYHHYVYIFGLLSRTTSEKKKIDYQSIETI